MECTSFHISYEKLFKFLKTRCYPVYKISNKNYELIILSIMNSPLWCSNH